MSNETFSASGNKKKVVRAMELLVSVEEILASLEEDTRNGLTEQKNKMYQAGNFVRAAYQQLTQIGA